MHKYLKLGIAIVVGILGGFYICILIKKYTLLKIDPTVSFEINPFEIFSLVVTIILAIYVAKILSKENDLDKSEKDLLINYLLSFKNEFNQKISYLIEQEEFDNVVTNSYFKIIRKKIDSIISLAIEYKFIEKNESFSNEIISKVRDVWELFTNTPKKANGKSSAAVKGDIERLRLEQVNKIEMTVIEIDKLLFQFTMKLNRK